MKKKFENILSKIRVERHRRPARMEIQKRNGLPLLIAAIILIVGTSAVVGCSVREDPAVSESPAGPPSYAEAVTAPELTSEGDHADDDVPAETAPTEDGPSESSFPEQTLSDEALAAKDVAEAFTAAFFAADEETLRQYLADDYEYPVELYSYPAEMAQNITFRGFDTIEAADNGQTAFVSVQFVNTPESDDSYQYLSIELVKQKDGWKVQFYGIEG